MFISLPSCFIGETLYLDIISKKTCDRMLNSIKSARITLQNQLSKNSENTVEKPCFIIGSENVNTTLVVKVVFQAVCNT